MYFLEDNIRARQRSGEGVVQRSGCPKECFWRPFFPAPLRFALKTSGNLKGGREETDSPKTPFWTTVSPHDAFSAFGVFPLFLPLAIAAFGGPEGYFCLAIKAFGAFQFIVPKYYYRLGKMDKRSLDSLI